MKQGSGNSSYGQAKREPLVHSINPAAVAQLGEMVGPARAVEPMYSGRGFEAPKNDSEDSHDCGSQGKW